MEKIAFKMQLKPGCKKEYIRRHAAIWPEIRALLKASGASDYTIFLDEPSNTLFAVQMISGGRSSTALGTDAIVQKWVAYMAGISITKHINSPFYVPMRTIYHKK